MKCHCIVKTGGVEIVKRAVRFQENDEKDVVVVGQDTDLLVLLTHYTLKNKNSKVYLYSPEKKITASKLFTPHSFINEDLKQVENLNLFCHAFTGCDTTSAFLNKGKNKLIKVLASNSSLAEKAKYFYKTEEVEKEVLVDNACEIIFELYKTQADESIPKKDLEDTDENGKTKNSLDKLRYFQYKKGIRKPTFKVDSLPPTNSAAKYHAYRVYLQVQLWNGNTDLVATKWGWIRSINGLEPVMGDKLVPEDILSKIFCKCKKRCQTMICTCRKHNVLCTDLCGTCNKESCENWPHDSFYLDLDDTCDAFDENEETVSDSDSITNDNMDVSLDLDSENEQIAL